jgi:hypothetical protein
MNLNQKVTDYIDNATADQIVILETLRKLIHETVGNVSEEIKWGFPVFASTKDFAYLRVAKKHITLGFYNIDKIKDPDNLLEGEGNTLKNIKIKNSDGIDSKIICKWLKEITN